MCWCGVGGGSTEAIHSDSSIIDDEVNALGVRVLQVFRKVLNAGFFCDVEMVVFDFC